MATKKQYRWAITLIRQRGKFLGYFEALDQETAIKKAIKHFQIKDQQQQKRLVAQPGDRQVLATS
jgi:hypothetical protein